MNGSGRAGGEWAFRWRRDKAETVLYLAKTRIYMHKLTGMVL